MKKLIGTNNFNLNKKYKI